MSRTFDLVPKRVPQPAEPVITVEELMEALRKCNPHLRVMVNVPERDELAEVDGVFFKSPDILELRLTLGHCAYCGGAADGSDDTCHCPKCRPARKRNRVV